MCFNVTKGKHTCLHTHTEKWCGAKMNNRTKEPLKKVGCAQHNSTAIKDSFQIWFNQFNTLNMSPSFTHSPLLCNLFCRSLNVSYVCAPAKKKHESFTIHLLHNESKQRDGGCRCCWISDVALTLKLLWRNTTYTKTRGKNLKRIIAVMFHS